MKLKYLLEATELDDELICVPVGPGAEAAEGVLKLNESGYEIVKLLEGFKAQSETLVMPEIPCGSFAKKLYSTYLSYLPKERIAFPLKMNEDARGSFTELMKSVSCGQFSVNISKPGITKGEHWHHTKNEKFLVVSGKGLIQFRRVGSDEIINYHVSGDKMEVVDIPTGYTHNIINEGETDLVTFMWCNECFDPEKPDTYFLKVEEE
jgi:UDP-2-acetamido-2,6-beta-L-arabino-hexul-4-ose reductase